MDRLSFKCMSRDDLRYRDQYCRKSPRTANCRILKKRLLSDDRYGEDSQKSRYCVQTGVRYDTQAAQKDPLDNRVTD